MSESQFGERTLPARSQIHHEVSQLAIKFASSTSLRDSTQFSTERACLQTKKRRKTEEEDEETSPVSLDTKEEEEEVCS